MTNLPGGNTMKIRTEQDITAAVARQLRQNLGLTQKDFWESVGSSQASGFWYEQGKRKEVPRPIRMLIFLRYVAMLDFDVSNPAEADAVIRMGRAMRAKKDAVRLKQAAQVAEELAKKAATKAENFKL